MNTVVKMVPKASALPQKKKVAAYARVSVETDRLKHSLSAQVSYFSQFVHENPSWEYVGVYTDEFISGTRMNKRNGFMQMIEDAEVGKFDILYVKSISRFARNTVDTLSTTRYLKSLGVEVRFEKENISSFSSEGEFMLTLMASFAQAESESISDNVKWARRKSFEKGDPQVRFPIFGYKWEGSQLIVDFEKAEVVKDIFYQYLHNTSAVAIAKYLNEKGIKTIRGETFDDCAIIYILKNITYTGTLLLQKTYTVDPINKRRVRNKGEVTQYLVDKSHEPIIDKETFDRVQRLIKQRADMPAGHQRYTNITPFYQKIWCGICGCSYCIGRKTGHTNAYACSCIQNKKPSCGNHALAEPTLELMAEKVLGEPATRENVVEKIEKIIVTKDETVKFIMMDGNVQEMVWKRRIKYKSGYQYNDSREPCIYDSVLTCDICGSKFRRLTRKKRKAADAYRCCKDGCNVQILLSTLQYFAKKAGGEEQIDSIVINGNTPIRFILKDGSERTFRWKKGVIYNPDLDMDQMPHCVDGKVFCAVCGNEYKYKKRSDGDTYQCVSQHKKETSCGNPMIRVKTIDSFITESMGGFNSELAYESIDKVLIYMEEIEIYFKNGKICRKTRRKTDVKSNHDTG